MLDFLVDSYIVVWILVYLLLSELHDIKSSITSYLSSVLGWCLIYLIVYVPEADPHKLNQRTDWLTGWLPLLNDWPTELTALTEPIYQTNCLIRRISKWWYWYWSDLNWTEDPSRIMAWLNDIPVPGSQPYTGKEPEWTKWTELNWYSSIMINGDDEDNGLNWHKVTYEDFLRYIHEKPEWLYGKLQLIYE